MYRSFRSIKLVHLHHLIGLLFQNAEESTRERIQLYCPEADEEWITNIYYEELATILAEANLRRDIESAFELDLSSVLNTFSNNYEIKSISQGLVASISKHKRSIEAHTGGDLGIVIQFPKLVFENNGLELERCGDQCGLLVQAKLRKYESSWGEFTKKQQSLLKKRTKYTSLLNYQYLDSENRKLGDFQWVLCSGFTLDQVANWLKTDKFPNSFNIKEIIIKLGAGSVGTTDRNIIERIICPDKSQAIIVTVDWKDRDPRYPVDILNNTLRKAQENKLVYIHLGG